MECSKPTKRSKPKKLEDLTVYNQSWALPIKLCTIDKCRTKIFWAHYRTKKILDLHFQNLQAAHFRKLKNYWTQHKLIDQERLPCFMQDLFAKWCRTQACHVPASAATSGSGAGRAGCLCWAGGVTAIVPEFYKQVSTVHVKVALFLSFMSALFISFSSASTFPFIHVQRFFFYLGQHLSFHSDQHFTFHSGQYFSCHSGQHFSFQQISFCMDEYFFFHAGKQIYFHVDHHFHLHGGQPISVHAGQAFLFLIGLHCSFHGGKHFYSQEGE